MPTPSRKMPSRSPLHAMFVITSMPVGGAETLLVNLVRRMDRSRILPSICCLKEPGVLGEEIARELPLHSRLTSGKLDPLVLPRLVRLMRSERIDAVVTVGAGDKMFWGRLAARLAGVRVVLAALHSTGWPDGVGLLNRLLTPLTDGFIAVAENHGRHLVEQERFPARRVFVIPNGIDTGRFSFSAAGRSEWRRKWGIGEEIPVTAIVAALRPEKNHLRFLEIAGRVRERLPNAHFAVVGDGPERESIQRRAAELGLTDCLRMTGATADIPGVLSASDLFALTSDNEASPVSILEALSCGRPVVAPDVGSIRETVRSGENGCLVPRDDTAAAADCWLRLLQDAELRQRFGSAGRQSVVLRASLDAMTNGYQDLIERLSAAGREGSLRSGQPADPGLARTH